MVPIPYQGWPTPQRFPDWRSQFPTFHSTTFLRQCGMSEISFFFFTHQLEATVKGTSNPGILQIHGFGLSINYLDTEKYTCTELGALTNCALVNMPDKSSLLKKIINSIVLTRSAILCGSVAWPRRALTRGFTAPLQPPVVVGADCNWEAQDWLVYCLMELVSMDCDIWALRL